MYAEFIKYFNADNMVKIIFSVTDKNFTFKKTTIKPLVLKCSRVFQVESFDGKKAFHKNLSEAELLKYIKDELISNYREVNIINDKTK